MSDQTILVSDPRAGYLALREEIDAAMRVVLEGPAYVLGAPVARFESAFASYVGVEHGVGVNNGTDAIHLALRALGVGVGDEVITVSHTAVATVAAVRMSGAMPVLADVDAGTRTISVEAARSLITPRTKAIIAVHLYGHPAEVDGLLRLCNDHGLKFIEDCAQAHGAMYKDRMVGSFGHASTFSFYPTKNLGAIGDGGMVLTNDADLARSLRLYRQYGWESPQYSLIEGWNSRLDPIQAAVLSVKLDHLPAHTARRRSLAARYADALKDLPLQQPMEAGGCRHVHHLYVVETKDQATRDDLRAFLLERGVQSGIHYPFPVHRQPAYRSWVRTSEMTTTDRLAATVLSLPLYPELDDARQVLVCEAIKDFFHRRP